MPRRAARTDTTARSLTTVARQMGAKVIPLNGVVDALVMYRGRVLIIDWKSDRTVRKRKDTETVAQARLIQEGWPIHLVSTEAQLKALLGLP